MKLNKKLFLVLLVLLLSPLIPSPIGEQVAFAAKMNTLGGPSSAVHRQHNSSLWDGSLSSDSRGYERWLLRSVNTNRFSWHQWAAQNGYSNWKIVAGYESPSAYTPPPGWEVQGILKYPVYRPRTYPISIRDCTLETTGQTSPATEAGDGRCTPHTFQGTLISNQWVLSISKSHWRYYGDASTWEGKTGPFYLFNAAQQNGYAYDFRIKPIADPEPPEEWIPPDPGGGGDPDPGDGGGGDPGPPEPPPNIPPTVEIYGPEEVMAGEAFLVWAAGEDVDGTVEEYRFSNVPSGTEQNDNLLYPSYPKTGNYSITVRAIDNEGAQSKPATHNVKVIAPQPSANFYVRGTEKENRKITLDPVHPYRYLNTYRAGVIEAFPMVEEKWSITAVDPENQKYIMTHANLNDNLSYKEAIDILIKIRGQYKVKRYVKNSIGLEDTVEKIITVQPDLLPVADFDVTTKLFRDDVKNQPEHSKAVIKAIDKSYSDDDKIGQRIWSYYYDSNNDEDFSDEEEVIVSSKNEVEINIRVEKVGKYLIQLKVIEEFGQPTIDEFVVPEDRRRHHVSESQTELNIPIKPLEQRIVTVDNLAPNATYNVRKKGETEQPDEKQPKVDVQIALDEVPYSISQVQSGMTKLRERLNAENIQANISVEPLKTPLKKVVDMSSSLLNSMFLLDSGEIYSAGNTESLNGLGTNRGDHPVPVSMIKTWADDAKAIAISQGLGHALILLDNGEAYYSGEIPYTSSHRRTNVPKRIGWDSGVIAAEAGYYSSFLLYGSGEVFSAGDAPSAMLGRGTSADTYWGQVIESWGTNKIVQVSSGTNHTLFLDEKGNVWATGSNDAGELGIGNKTEKNKPVAVTKTWGSKKVKQVSAGRYVSYFLLETGEVYAAGNGYYGQIGDGSNTDRTKPVPVSETWGNEKVASVNAGQYSGFFLLENGEVYAVGENTEGELGDGTKIDKNKPVKVVNTWGDAKVKKVHYSVRHTLFLLETGEVYVVGRNDYGQFGNGTKKDSTKALPILDSWNQSRDNSAWKESYDMMFGVLLSRDAVDSTHIANQMLGFDASFVGVGAAGNRSQMEAIIQRNLNRGTFIREEPNGLTDNQNIERIANELADYIISEIKKKQEAKELYLTLDEQADYQKSYNDAENDPLLTEKWKFAHDPSVFENNMGQDPRHLKELTAPIEQFSKVGLYRPNYSAKDEPIFWKDNRFDSYRKWSPEYDEWSIFVHRKPVPKFSFTIDTKRNYTITNEAYDLDKQSIDIGNGPGIRKQTWYWREKGQSTWQEGLPASPLSNKVYEIKNSVIDFQHREESVIKELNASGVNVPPIPLFSLDQEVEQGQIFVPKDMSYDPNGDDITEWRWWIKKVEEDDTDSTADINFEEVPSQPSRLSNPELLVDEKGTYIVRLQVKDEHGLWSADPNKYAYQTINVYSTNEAPMAGFTVKNAYVGSPLVVTSTADDPNGDPLTYSYQVITPYGDALTVETGSSTLDRRGNPITLDEFGNFSIQTYDTADVGTWTFTQTVTDPDGAVTQDGPKTAEVYPLILSGNVFHTDEWLRIHMKEGNPPNSFYSGEKFLLGADVSDYPIKSSNVSISGILETGEPFSANVSLSQESNTYLSGSYFEERFAKKGTMIKEGSEVSFVFTVVYENDYSPEEFEVKVNIIDNVFNYLNSRYHRNY